MVVIAGPADLGRVIRTRRRLLRWSQSELAGMAGMGRNWLVEVEAGKKSGARLDHILRLLNFLGCQLHTEDDLAVEVAPLLQGGVTETDVEPALQTHPKSGDRTRQTSRPVMHAGVDGPFAFAGESEDTQVGRLSPEGSICDEQRGDERAVTAGYDIYGDAFRPRLEAAVRSAVQEEGPIFLDCLARRVAASLGREHAKKKLLDLCETITRPLTHTLEDGDRKVIWPDGVDTKGLFPFRSDGRDHRNIPIVELAGLAAHFMAAAGHVDGRTVDSMRKTFGLSRLAADTRQRFDKAVRIASDNRSLGAQIKASD